MMILYNPPGRLAEFVQIEVCVETVRIEFNLNSLDRAGKKRLREATDGRSFTVFKGVARISWKNEGARTACIVDHQESGKRRERWRQVQAFALRMEQGEYPPHGHVYVIGASEKGTSMMVIDGTRRMLAYLESGQNQMPVIAICIDGDSLLVHDST